MIGALPRTVSFAPRGRPRRGHRRAIGRRRQRRRLGRRPVQGPSTSRRDVGRQMGRFPERHHRPQDQGGGRRSQVRLRQHPGQPREAGGGAGAGRAHRRARNPRRDDADLPERESAAEDRPVPGAEHQIPQERLLRRVEGRHMDRPGGHLLQPRAVRATRSRGAGNVQGPRPSEAGRQGGHSRHHVGRRPRELHGHRICRRRRCAKYRAGTDAVEGDQRAQVLEARRRGREHDADGRRGRGP